MGGVMISGLSVVGMYLLGLVEAVRVFFAGLRPRGWRD